MNAKPLEQLTYEDFFKAIKSKFRVWIDSQNSLELELSEVTTPRISTAGGAKAAYENFALNFDGPADKLLPQRIYCFESTALGRFELFIVPVGCSPRTAQYQATFNRLLKPV